MKVIERGPTGQVIATELNDLEAKVRDRFERHLDRGTSVRVAARWAIGSRPSQGLTAEFVEWLSDDTLTLR